MTTFALWLSVVSMLSVLVYVFGTLFWNIREERRTANLRRVWPHFGLSLVFATLFVVTLVAHGFADWGVYAQDQRAQGQQPTLAGYGITFSEDTLQNWQSEFLQNFSFIALAALLIHRRSAESKDGEEQIQAALERIERRLDEAGLGS